MRHRADSAESSPNLQSPELSFLASIVLMAFNDLDTGTEADRFESVQFFLGRSPERRDYRRMLFSLLGLNEQVVTRIVEQKVQNPPERPETPKPAKPTADDVFRQLPDGVFSRKDVVVLMGGALRYESVVSRLQVLEEWGKVQRIGRGKFVKVEWLQSERAAILAEVDEDLLSYLSAA